MKGLMLLANGFEDTEGLSTRDVLIRAGLEITTASILKEDVVKTSHNILLKTDTTIFDIDINDFDFLILPGGGLGTQNLKSSLEVKNIIEHFDSSKKLICAICAAPSILESLGLLKGRKFTCFKGCNYGTFGAIYTGNEIEIDDRFITARAMMYSIPFGLAIVEKLLGKEIKDKVLIGLQGK